MIIDYIYTIIENGCCQFVSKLDSDESLHFLMVNKIDIDANIKNEIEIIKKVERIINSTNYRRNIKKQINDYIITS